MYRLQREYKYKLLESFVISALMEKFVFILNVNECVILRIKKLIMTVDVVLFMY